MYGLIFLFVFCGRNTQRVKVMRGIEMRDKADV